MKGKKLLILLVVLSLVIIPLLFTGCKPAAKAAPEPTGQTPFTQLQNQVSSLQQRVSTLESKGPGTDVSSIKSDVSTLKSDLQTLKDKLSSIQSSISSLDSRISNISNPTPAPIIPTPIAPTQVILVSTRYLDIHSVSLAGNTSAVISVPVKLKLENTLNVKVDEIILTLLAETRASLGLQITSVEITSSQKWIQYSAEQWELWDELTLNAKAEATYQMIVSITVKNITGTAISNGSVMLSLLFNVESYDT